MKPKVLLLHGALGAAAQFESLEKLLSPTFEVYKLDFSGHGKQKEHPGKFSIQEFSNDILHFLNEKEIDSISTFGYSMGGFVALHLALLHPAKVNKIVTLATKFEWTPEIATAETRFLNPQKTIEKVPAFASELQKLHGDKWEAVMNQTALLLHDLGANHPLTKSQLECIKCPVLLCLGDKDKMVSLSETHEVKEAIPRAEMHLLKDCQHPLEQVNKADLCTELIRFF